MVLLICLVLFIAFIESQDNRQDRHCNQTIECANTNVDITNGRLYCEGYLGCARSTLNALNGIFCSGHQGCAESTIETLDLVVCSGKSGCSGSKKLRTLSGVRCTGEYGCSWIPELTSTTFGVICDGYYSCLHSNITATGVRILYLYNT